MGRQISSNSMAGSTFVGIPQATNPRPVLSSFSPPFKISPLIVNAFLPAAISLNSYTSEKVDLGFIENRAMRRALSTTFIGGGVTLSALYASGFLTQGGLTTSQGVESPRVSPQVLQPAEQTFQWLDESLEDDDSRESDEFVPDGEAPLETETEALVRETDASQTQMVIVEEALAQSPQPASPEKNFRDTPLGKSYTSPVKPYPLTVSASAFLGFIMALRSNASNRIKSLIPNTSNVAVDGFEESHLSAFWKEFLAFLFLLWLYRSPQYTAAGHSLPRAIVEHATLSPTSEKPLGTACTDPSLRVFLSARGVPLRLPLLGRRGRILTTIEDVAYRDCRLDPYGSIVKGGTGVAGARAALLGPDGPDNMELCLRSSGVDPTWQEKKLSPGTAPKLTSLITISASAPSVPVKESVLSLPDGRLSRDNLTLQTYTRLIDALVGLLLGILGFSVAVGLLLVSVPVMLVAGFVLSAAFWLSGQNNASVGPDQSPSLSIRKNAQRMKKPIVHSARSSTKGIRRPLVSSTPAAFATPPNVLVADGLVIPVDLNPAITVIPPTPALVQESFASGTSAEPDEDVELEAPQPEPIQKLDQALAEGSTPAVAAENVPVEDLVVAGPRIVDAGSMPSSSPGLESSGKTVDVPREETQVDELDSLLTELSEVPDEDEEWDISQLESVQQLDQVLTEESITITIAEKKLVEEPVFKEPIVVDREGTFLSTSERKDNVETIDASTDKVQLELDPDSTIADVAEDGPVEEPIVEEPCVVVAATTFLPTVEPESKCETVDFPTEEKVQLDEVDPEMAEDSTTVTIAEYDPVENPSVEEHVIVELGSNPLPGTRAEYKDVTVEPSVEEVRPAGLDPGRTQDSTTTTAAEDAVEGQRVEEPYIGGASSSALKMESDIEKVSQLDEFKPVLDEESTTATVTLAEVESVEARHNEGPSIDDQELPSLPVLESEDEVDTAYSPMDDASSGSVGLSPEEIGLIPTICNICNLLIEDCMSISLDSDAAIRLLNDWVMGQLECIEDDSLATASVEDVTLVLIPAVQESQSDEEIPLLDVTLTVGDDPTFLPLKLDSEPEPHGMGAIPGSTSDSIGLADKTHLATLSSLQAVDEGEDEVERQRIVDDVIEAHIQAVEARTNGGLASSMWSDMPSGSFQSNAQLLSSKPVQDAGSTASGLTTDYQGDTLGDWNRTQRMSQGIQTDPLILDTPPMVKLPPSTSRSSFTSSSTSRLTSSMDGFGQGARGGNGKRWGAPNPAAPGPATQRTPKKRQISSLPVPDWANATS